jgi:Calx-beta domain-containing protein
MKRSSLFLGVLAVSVAAGLSSVAATPAASGTSPAQTPVKVWIGDQAANEGTTAVMTMHMSARLSVPVTVYWTTVDGTAKAPADYATQSGSVVFSPGQTSAPCSVIVKDHVYEGSTNEYFYIHSWVEFPLTGMVTIGPDAKLTIIDNDAL